MTIRTSQFQFTLVATILLGMPALGRAQQIDLDADPDFIDLYIQAMALDEGQR